MTVQEILDDARKKGRAFLDEAGTKQIIETFGVAIPRGVVVRDRAELNSALAGLRRPVAVKLISPDASHKSDVGGVKLGLATAQAVEEAFETLKRTASERKLRFDGALIEEMVPAGSELVVGGIIDRRFGPVIMLGLGGIFVEIFHDVSCRICPIDRRDVTEMIDDLRSAPILRGARGMPPVSEQAITGVLLAVGGADGLLMRLTEEIAELDINPLIVSEQGAFACDARLILSKRDAAVGQNG